MIFTKGNRAALTHGMRKAPEYYIWNAMIQRCHNPRSRSYSDYGGRGITVYQDWRSDFVSFFSHVGRRPSNMHTLERIDNSKGYGPGNVRWVTRPEQSRNKRNNRLITHGDKTMCMTDWLNALKLNRYTVYKRLRNGQGPLEALGLT